MSADLSAPAVPEPVSWDFTGFRSGVTEAGTDVHPVNDGDLTVRVVDPVEAWTAVLESLELAIDEAIAGDLATNDLDDAGLTRLTVGLGGWTPPADVGPIPAELVERARHISERQQDAAAQLARELRTLRQHRSVLGSVQTATAPQQASVYLDVTG